MSISNWIRESLVWQFLQINLQGIVLKFSFISGIKNNLYFTSYPEIQLALTNQYYFSLCLLLQLDLFTFSNKLEIKVSCIS